MIAYNKRLTDYTLLRRLILILLVCYILWIFYITLYDRPPHSDYRYNYQLFWSYIEDGDGSFYFKENILNLLIFIPIGLVFPIVWKRTKLWHVFIIGLMTSVSIESLQLVLKRGFSELDDVFHNTLGAILGFVLFKGIVAIYEDYRLELKK